jgi:adenosine deaminase
MLPKAEIHVHLEGTATPHLVRQLAKRNEIELPEHIFKSEELFAWQDFLDFLNSYELASGVIKHPRDYYDITFDYLQRCANEGALYVEMMYSPEHAERASGIPSHEHLLAIDQAIKDAREQFDIEGGTLITCVRHYGLDACVKVAKHAVEAAAAFDTVVGLGMGGDEAGYPPALFKTAFDIAAAAGIPCTIHAGEMDGPERIWEAIDTLPVNRLGHGVRAIEDPKLIDTIIERDIVLEVCPTSNIVLGVYQDYQAHPLLDLIKAGVKVTLNSDDPPYFGTTIGQEYAIAEEQFGLTPAQLRHITKTAIQASYLDKATKQRLLAKC